MSDGYTILAFDDDDDETESLFGAWQGILCHEVMTAGVTFSHSLPGGNPTITAIILRAFMLLRILASKGAG